jgi:hypothetical protein
MINEIKKNDVLNKNHNFQKFNVEKYNDELSINNNNKEIKCNKNNIKICEQCKSIINSFSLNQKLIKLLFNLPKYSVILNNNTNNKLINNILKNPNICSNCFKNLLNIIYFNDNNANSNNIIKIENEIIKMIQVLENMKEEKLNININIYHGYKKLMHSFIEYINENHQNNESNEYDNINSIFFNIKNQELIGVDCMLNIIDLLNKNISLIKEKNTIKSNFIKEIINEKNMLINDFIKNKNDDNIFNLNNDNNSKEKSNINDNFIKSKNNTLLQLNKRDKNIENQHLFKTKIIKTKHKKKRFKRKSHKIKFTIKTK